ncbi:NMRK2 [Bugula neritina]|uniref:NMRK2 n=1 Tax=Bugula neritina TaxID=10212 RepID=A0A7J7JCE4_BUGNE|nr:NMRK2 [Bugula neritina]KAF6038671.1 NMRK2 [Bugula neritina]
MASELAPLVLGLGGVTCGGKTTVANYLKGQLPKDSLAVIHQDDYYWPEDSSHWNNDGTDNWDELAAFDMDKLIKDVKEKISQKFHYIIIEGIMLYEDTRLEELIDRKYFFILPYEECKNRRVLRAYEPPEPYPEYFDVMYWPVYQQQLELFTHRADIKLVDSTNIIEAIQDAILADIQ